MKIYKKYYLTILFINVFLIGDEPFEEFKVLKEISSYKIPDKTISIDGKLNESYWTNSVIVNDFIQANPYYGKAPSKNTHIRVLHDNEYIYVGVHLEDNPELLSCSYAQNDDWDRGFDNNSDYFVIEIDSNHDHRTSYGFAVNCLGIKADYMMYNDSPEFVDDDWNEYWESDVSINNNGWYIEYKIPFKILNYQDNLNFGINFLRYIKRLNEDLLWVLLPQEYIGAVSHYGHINNLNVDKKNNFQFKPYFVYGDTKYKNRYFDYDENNNLDLNDFMHKNHKFNQDRYGFDIKYLFNSNILFNYAYKPDYGQIEQHPAELNFTNYEIYYDDKRPFFTENSSLFDTPIDLIYTHDIGGSIYMSDIHCDKTIVHATKVARSNQNIDFAIMNTKENIVDLSGYFSDETVDSRVIRLKKKILNSRSFIGIMKTKYSNPIDDSDVNSIDGLLNLYNNKLKIDGQFVRTNLNDMYKGKGYNYEISYSDKLNNDKESFFSNNIINVWLGAERYDRNFEINQVGFLLRNNFKSFNIGIAFENENEDKKIIKRILNFQNIIKKNINNDNLGKIFAINWRFIFKNHWYFNSSFLYTDEHYNDWYFQEYTYSYNENNNIIKMPSSRELIIEFGNNPSSRYSFNYQLNIFKNSLSDSSLDHTLNTYVKISNFFTIDFGMFFSNYSDKYNFLKIRKIVNNNEPNEGDIFVSSFNNIYRESEQEKIYFSDSDISEKKFTILSTINTKKYLSIQTYIEYHKKINDYTSFYELTDSDKYKYPSTIKYFNSEDEKIQDDLLYMNKVSTLKLNQILKWDINRKINIYFIYSVFKRLSGKDFKSINSILDFKPKLEDRIEQFYDESFFFKIDFMLGN